MDELIAAIAQAAKDEGFTEPTDVFQQQVRELLLNWLDELVTKVWNAQNS